jgi:hypothetical protein
LLHGKRGEGKMIEGKKMFHPRESRAIPSAAGLMVLPSIILPAMSVPKNRRAV